MFNIWKSKTAGQKRGGQVDSLPLWRSENEEARWMERRGTQREGKGVKKTQDGRNDRDGDMESRREHNLRGRNSPRTSVVLNLLVLRHYQLLEGQCVYSWCPIWFYFAMEENKLSSNTDKRTGQQKVNRMACCLSNCRHLDCNFKSSNGSQHFLIAHTGWKMTLNYSELTSRP